MERRLASNHILYHLSKERDGRVLLCPVPKPVNLQSKSVVSKLCCTIKSPGVKKKNPNMQIAPRGTIAKCG